MTVLQPDTKIKPVISINKIFILNAKINDNVEHQNEKKKIGGHT